ncbi:LruC domain-containing protein [Reichenbachiella versicolor]|uniref:LruC domain-containing protein n=1 Tax=Reichenbachiella versicolor TaxID=1821036 RepID=UPI000D6E0A5A|nr:LruC domain-containing protein [Reichenbachiella versicolor]
MKRATSFTLIFLIPLMITSCIDKLDQVTPEKLEDEYSLDSLTSIKFPEGYDFATTRNVKFNISEDCSRCIYRIYYDEFGSYIYMGSYADGDISLTLPSSSSTLLIEKDDGLSRVSKEVNVQSVSMISFSNNNGRAINGITSSTQDDGACIDYLHAVNNNGDNFTIDLTNDEYSDLVLPNLQGGGSIANAIDQENGLMYYNIGTTMYAYDISSSTFSVLHQGNPFNGSYPRLEYKDGFFYMGNNGSRMYKVDAVTNEVVLTYNVTGFVNSTSGGDLAFDSNGDLYLACFSGLYKFTSINEETGDATITRISAENFPFQLTSMAIDRQDRIFVGTNDSNSRLIQISKEDGSYSIVRTFDRKINDLTAWKCDADDLDQADSDGDGIINILDDFPDDPEVAFETYTPSELGNGTIAFEDLWPYQGDYDFNDLVIGYRFVMVQNAENRVVRMRMEFSLKAIGASIHSGFGLGLDIDKNKIESVQGYSDFGQLISRDAKGLESNQSKAVLVVFNDAYDYFQGVGENFINTNKAEPVFDPVDFEVSIEFTEPVSIEELGNVPFDPFIFSSYDRGVEVHLANKPPTDLANTNTLGTEDDASNPSTGKYYVNENNLPWGIHVIHTFRYPIEKKRISQAYNRFIDWGMSEGSLYSDWYGDNSGYRNMSNIYTQ